MFLLESLGQGFGGYYESRRPSGVGRLGKECGVVVDGVGLAISRGRMNLRKKNHGINPLRAPWIQLSGVGEVGD